MLEWLPCPLPRDLPDPGIEPGVYYFSCIGRQVLYHYYHLGSPSTVDLSIILATRGLSYDGWWESEMKPLLCTWEGEAALPTGKRRALVTACLIHRLFRPHQHFNNFPWALLNPSRVNCKARNKKRLLFKPKQPRAQAQLLWLSASLTPVSLHGSLTSFPGHSPIQSALLHFLSGFLLCFHL